MPFRAGFTAGLLSCVCAFAAESPGPGNKDDKSGPPPAAKVRFVQDRFAIGFWVAPPADEKLEERYQEVAQAHFTLVLGGFSPSTAKRQLALCEKLGMKALVEDRVRAAFAEKLSDYPACWGYGLMDEPAPSNFPGLRSRVESLRLSDPEKLGFINLLPNYAPVWALGPNGYEGYVSQFVAEVEPDVLCMDHYPLFKPGADGRARYCQNLEVLRKYSLMANIPFWNFFVCVSIGVQDSGEHGGEYGAEGNPTGHPIGGGRGYRRIIQPARSDYLVRSPAELIQALQKVRAGETVYVADRSEIDLTGHGGKVAIPFGVTLASGRGRGDAPGALIYTTEFSTMPLFQIRGHHVRLTGLRVRGADTETRTSTYELPVARAVDTRYQDADGKWQWSNSLEVDNCEFWGWSHAAIYVTGHGHHVHHNHIHHCRREGLGYGVCLSYDPARVLIEANRFDHNRHDIAATGAPGNAYEACYNISAGGGTAHAFDMHGGRYYPKGTSGGVQVIGGDWVSIHHNTFDVGWPMTAILIRATPRWRADIYHNRFVSGARAIGAWGGGVHCRGNRFEEERMTKYDFTFPKGYNRKSYLLDRPNTVDGKVVETAK